MYHTVQSNLISIKDFMECINYQITEGYEYLWSAFGDDSYTLSSEDASYQKYHVSITFSKVSHTVFIMEAWDYQKNKAYRWINPNYKHLYLKECNERGVDSQQALDDLKFTDLEVSDDILEKAKAIINGESYDDRVIVPLNLPDEELFRLMMLAHEADMTLNQYVEKLLRVAIDDFKKEEERPTWEI